MREGLFIKKHKDRWEQIEHDRSRNADEMAGNFTRLVNDLGYAKTFYPTSKITAYLNALASRIYLNIYQNRKDPSNRLAVFFRYDVPMTIAKRYRFILFSFTVFILFLCIGFFSATQDATFVRQVLGDRYVEVTEENIKSGNPFSIYAQTGPFLMWVEIMINNIIVSIMYFFRGLLLGIWSITALAKEGIRLGAFEHMFYAHHLGLQAVVTVLLHGLLELTAIIMACSAGLIMGTSFLFPKTHSRLRAFREGVKDGVKIIVVIIPVLMIAAFIEGYITRYYKMPLYMSLSILTICGTFILWYFVLYPIALTTKRLQGALPLPPANA